MIQFDFREKKNHTLENWRNLIDILSISTKLKKLSTDVSNKIKTFLSG